MADDETLKRDGKSEEANFRVENVNEDTVKSSDSKPQSNYSVFPQVVACLCSSLAVFGVTSNSSFCAVVIPQLQNETNPAMRMTLEEGSNLPALHFFGMVVGGPVGGMMASRIGRKKTLLFFSACSIGAWCFTFAAWNKLSMYAAKFTSSFFATTMSSAAVAYISEVSHANIRGNLLLLSTINRAVGILAVFSVGYFVPWRVLALVCCAPATILFLSFLILPESPFWLMHKKRVDEARKSLQFLRGKRYNIEAEISELVTVQPQNRRLAQRLCDNCKPFLGLIAIGAIYIFSGYCFYTSYMVTIFQESGTSMEPTLAPIIVFSAMLIATILSATVISKLSRKWMLSICSLLLALSNAGIGVYSYLVTIDESFVKYGWVPVLGTVIYMSASSFGVGPFIDLLAGETFPMDLKTQAMSVAQIIIFMLTGILVKLFPFFLDTIGAHGLYFSFAIISLGGVIFGAFCITETQGMTLKELEDNLRLSNRVSKRASSKKLISDDVTSEEPTVFLRPS